MHLEVVTGLADWYAGVGPAAGKGVNDFLPLVPRLELDVAEPTPIALFADHFRDDCAAAFDTPSKHPAIYVLPEGPVTPEGEAGPRSRHARSVAAVARLILRDPQNARSTRYASYVLRALGMSTAAFLADDEAGREGRARGDVFVVSANTITFGPWREAVGESAAVAVYAVDLAVRDHNPRGT